jgi:hypothetical protein
VRELELGLTGLIEEMSLDRCADFFERSARVQLAAERFGYLRRECLSGIQMVSVQLVNAFATGAEYFTLADGANFIEELSIIGGTFSNATGHAVHHHRRRELRAERSLG